MTRRPLVSIVTPTLNQGDFIEDTLRSVAMQDYPNIEHIVVDGGSTDRTREILERWSGRIRWISEPDGGQAEAIVTGFAMARGEVLTWLNSDDLYLADDVVSEVVAMIEGGSQAVTGSGTFLDRDGNHLSDWPHANLRRIGYEDLKCRDTILQPATFFTADLAGRCPIDTRLSWAFDWDLFIRMTQLVNFTPLHRSIAGYRWHDRGKTYNGNVARKRELLEISRRYRGRLHIVTLALQSLLPIYSVSDKLPRSIGAATYRVVDRGCRFTHRLTQNRGIPY